MRRRSKDTPRPGPMTYLQAKAVVEDISYKPDWEITLKPAWYGDPTFATQSVTLEARFAAIDSTDPRQERDTDVFFDVTFYLDDVPTPEALLHFVKQTITQAEMHERDEWLRYQGELVDDPHRPGRDGRAEIPLSA